MIKSTMKIRQKVIDKKKEKEKKESMNLGYK